MSILKKAEEMIIVFDGKDVDEPVRVYMGDMLLKVVKKSVRHNFGQ